MEKIIKQNQQWIDETWEKIEKRLRLAAQADFVICIYKCKCKSNYSKRYSSYFY